MSAGYGGRRGSLPPAGYRPAARLDQTGCVVRFASEHPAEPPVEFDFTGWPISGELRRAFAAAFAERTRPGGRVRTVASATKTYRHLRRFAEYLAGLLSPPATAAELSPAHLHGWLLPRREHRGVSAQLGELKTTLRKVEGLSGDFRAVLNERNPPRQKAPAKRSYSRAENQRILNAARRDIRAAADRLRGNQTLLARWRDGDLNTEPPQTRRRGELLDHVERHTDVPRSQTKGSPPMQWVSGLGTVEEHLTALHLSSREAAAFAVLLVGLTGQNASTILKAPASHHRADGYTGTVASAIVELDKPRRGARRHMDVPFTSVPSWAPSADSENDDDLAQRADPPDRSGAQRVDLHSALGVYLLLCELAAPARRILRTDRLFAWWAGSGGMGVGAGLRTGLHTDLVLAWARAHDLPTDATASRGDDQHDADGASRREQLNVTLGRLRLTFTELQQRPVAHSPSTVANEYLARNRGNLAEYQKVVADVLAEQVTKATTRGRLHTLSQQDIEEARDHPARVAARHGMDPATLERLLRGDLDTVLGGCIDHTNSPHTPAGQACRASFLLCLSCPCARATPAHLPLHVLVYDQLEQRRMALTPLQWAQRVALPHGQLADLLNRAGPAAVTDARATATSAQQDLVGRFLNRELDHP